MKFEKYIELCKTTESASGENLEVDVQRLNTAIQLITTGNRLLDLLKKEMFYGKNVNGEDWLSLLRNINLSMNDAMEHHRKSMAHTICTDNVIVNRRIAHSIIGINTEAGELLEALDASINLSGSSNNKNVEFDLVNYGEELGDLCWYMAIGIDAANLTFNDVLNTNRKKLESRYSSGKFTKTEAIERSLDKERKILEDGITEDTTLPD